MDNVSVSFKCICGGATCWVSATPSEPCPFCGRRYYGKYNSETLQIDVFEVVMKNEITEVRGGEKMKITKGQTAMIVMAIAGVIGALVLVNFVKVHPIYAILIGLAAVGVGVGYYMYKRNG